MGPKVRKLDGKKGDWVLPYLKKSTVVENESRTDNTEKD